MQHFLVVRSRTKKNLAIHEYATLDAALCARSVLRAENSNGEVVLCFAETLDELLTCFSDYRPNFVLEHDEQDRPDSTSSPTRHRR